MVGMIEVDHARRLSPGIGELVADHPVGSLSGAMRQRP